MNFERGKDPKEALGLGKYAKVDYANIGKNYPTIEELKKLIDVLDRDIVNIEICNHKSQIINGRSVLIKDYKYEPAKNLEYKDKERILKKIQGLIIKKIDMAKEEMDCCSPFFIYSRYKFIPPSLS